MTTKQLCYRRNEAINRTDKNDYECSFVGCYLYCCHSQIFFKNLNCGFALRLPFRFIFNFLLVCRRNAKQKNKYGVVIKRFI